VSAPMGLFARRLMLGESGGGTLPIVDERGRIRVGSCRSISNSSSELMSSNIVDLALSIASAFENSSPSREEVDSLCEVRASGMERRLRAERRRRRCAARCLGLWATASNTAMSPSTDSVGESTSDELPASDADTTVWLMECRRRRTRFGPRPPMSDPQQRIHSIQPSATATNAGRARGESGSIPSVTSDASMSAR
jgi:hypothetical protein